MGANPVVFHGRVPNKDFDLKMGTRPQKPSMTKSKTAGDVLRNRADSPRFTQKRHASLHQIRCCLRQKAKSFKLQERNHVSVVQTKADNQCTKILFSDFSLIGPYTVKEVLPFNKFLLSKIATDNEQVRHRMILSPFTPRGSTPNVHTTSQEWKPDPEIIIGHEDLYARAWESDLEISILTMIKDKPRPPTSRGVTVEFDHTTAEVCSKRGTIQESSPKNSTKQTEYMTERIRITT